MEGAVEGWIGSSAGRRRRGGNTAMMSRAAGNHHKCFSLGVCAMAMKVESRPMQSILKRLQNSYDFQIVQFNEQMILEQDIVDWPKVDCLIAFHSTRYPLEKVQNYIKATKPITLNDVFAMKYLRSRIDVFRILQQSGIPTPSHIIIDHFKCREEGHDFEEHYDYIQYNGLRLNKPFIEKPADADNHNNYVYYPRNTGGGCKKLFRKVKDRSSEFYPDIHQVRRDGTYVYEEFLSTFGTDVKVYTVGQIFAHAEARKSPTLDGKVQRTENGKEVRYPVILTDVEKYMAYQIVEAFKQTVCGFDILRTTNGQSVVCDVNGWSFVKGNVKYYNDCAHIIRILFLNRLQEKFHFIPRELPEGWCNNVEQEEDTLRKTFVNVEEEVIHGAAQDEELRIVVVVMRHGDRKPKQKLKFESTEPEILEYHQQASGGSQTQILINPKKEVKLKSSEELQELLEKTRTILARLEQDPTLRDSTCLKFLDNIRLLQSILEQGDGFTGINRKFQIKPISWEEVELSSGERQLRVTRQLVVAKWGGELTRVGRAQAEDLGKRLRIAMYPGDEEGGLLRLHSTFRHDLKIYTSDEGRCQVTSAAFTKGFLDLEGELTPILVQMVVRNAKAHALLDSSPIHVEARERCKQLLDNILNEDRDLYKEVQSGTIELREDQMSSGSRESLKKVGNPRKKMQEIQELIELFLKALNEQIQRFNSVILEQKRQASVFDSKKSCCDPESSEFKTIGSWNSALSRKDSIGTEFSLSAACLNSPALIALQQEDLSTLKDYSETQEFEGTSSSVMIRATRPLQHPVEYLRGDLHSVLANDVQIGNEKRLSTFHCGTDLECFFNAEVATCASCRLVVLLSERLKEIRYRWIELHDSWYKSKTAKFDTSKITDVVDNVRFDLIHHHTHIGTKALHIAFEIYRQVEPLGNFVAPVEYGITPHDKAEIGTKSISRLLKKILKDVTFFRHVPDQVIPQTTHSTCHAQPQHKSTLFGSQGSKAVSRTPSIVNIATANNSQKTSTQSVAFNPVAPDMPVDHNQKNPPMTRSSSTTSLVTPRLTNLVGDDSTVDTTRQNRTSFPVKNHKNSDGPKKINELDDASPSPPTVGRKSSAPLCRPGRSSPLTSEEVSSRDVPLISPAINRMGSNALNQVENPRGSPEGQPTSSPSHKKRHDSITTPATTGGETYWLVPQTSEPPDSSQAGGSISPCRPPVLPSPSLTAGFVQGVDKVMPLKEIGAQEASSIREVSADSVGSCTGISVDKMSKIESDSSVPPSATVVINSDSLWGHQPPAKDTSSSAKDQDRSKPDRKPRSAAQAQATSLSEAATSVAYGLDLSTHIAFSRTIYPSISGSTTHSTSIAASLSPQDLPDICHHVTGPSLPSAGELNQQQTKKQLVVSSTDQHFEPEGGIYVGFSSHSAASSRRQGSTCLIADKGLKSPTPLSTTANIVTSKAHHRKSSGVSATSGSKQPFNESCMVKSPESNVESSLNSIGSFEPVTDRTVSDVQDRENDPEDIDEEWESGDEAASKANPDDEQPEEEEEEDDLDDDRTHFRLKEEEAKQMGIKSPWRIVRSRYYIASASHIISLYNILLHGSTVLNEPDVSFQTKSISPQLVGSKGSGLTSSHGSVVSKPSMTAGGTSTAGISTSTIAPSLSPPFKHMSSSTSAQSTGSLISSNVSHHSEYPCSSKAPVLVDLDAQKDADSVTDVHYLSHIVFRVWEKKNVEYSDPQRFRVEIQFSSGAKDGFGSNYELLREHTKTQQQVFQQHLEHLLTHHASNNATGAYNNECDDSSVSTPQMSLYRQQTLLMDIDRPESNEGSKEDDASIYGGEGGGLSPKTSRTSYSAAQPDSETSTEPPTQLLPLAFSPYSGPSNTSRSGNNLDGRPQQIIFYNEKTAKTYMDSNTRLNLEKGDGTTTPAPSSPDDPVPPYCEIQPLLRLTKSSSIVSLETIFQSLLKHFATSQSSSASSAASTVAASSSSRYGSSIEHQERR